jgi:hypothetical protein
MPTTKFYSLCRLLPLLLVAVGLTMVLLACAPGGFQKVALPGVSGEPVTVTVPIQASPTITTVCSSYIQKEVPENFERNPPTSPIHWTITFNFKATSQAQFPVGCFRIYERRTDSNGNPIFEDIDGGGFVIDTCDGKSPKIEFSRTGMPTAIFAGDSYLKCEINISQWVTTLLRMGQLSPSSQDLLSNLINSSSERYENFTMYARGTISTSNAAHFPIMYYKPHDSPRQVIGMSIHLNQWKTQEYMDAWLKEQHFSSEENCSLDPFTKSVGRWVDFRTDRRNGRAFSTLEFQWGNSAIRKCQSTPDIASSEPTTTIDFWIREATLYIGIWPEPDKPLFGTLQEVLVDPCDAKPGGG